MIVNDLVIRSANRDREREVETYSEYNKINNYSSGSTANQKPSTEKRKNFLGLWFLIVANRLKGVLAIDTKDSLKVKKIQ